MLEKAKHLCKLLLLIIHYQHNCTGTTKCVILNNTVKTNINKVQFYVIEMKFTTECNNYYYKYVAIKYLIPASKVIVIIVNQNFRF